jgi:hypothetical protein
MSVELWRSVVPIYVFMFLNLLAVGAALAWAVRRDLFRDEDVLRRAPLDDKRTLEENDNG